MSKYFRVERQDGLAIVTMDDPQSNVNTISEPFLLELDSILNELSAEQALQGLVLKCNKPGNFIAGADINMIRRLQDAGGDSAYNAARQGKRVLSKLSSLPFPTVALISGQCLGGGAELALACTYRVASHSGQSEEGLKSDKSNAAIGFPEIKLQLFPGLGGTVRLPKLVGVSNALNLILNGNTVDAAEAWRIGLVDAVSTPEEMLTTARSVIDGGPVPFQSRPLAEKIRQFIKHPKAVLKREAYLLLDRTRQTSELVIALNRRAVEAVGRGNYPAPLAAIDVIRRSLTDEMEKALEYESARFGSIVNTAVARAFVDLYFAQNETRRISRLSLLEEPITRVGVVGDGVMGSGITQLAAFSGLEVVLKSETLERSAAAKEKISKLFQSAVKKGRITAAQMHQAVARIHTTLDNADLADCDIIVEAIWEDLDAKKKLVADLEKVIDKPFYFASNTSSMSIAAIAEASRHPQNVFGLHFFNPVHRMVAVEVVRAESTSGAAFAKGVGLAQLMGRTPVPTADSAGFLVNRILTPYMVEALRLVAQGVPPADIDYAMKKFGMPMGPLALIDEVGIDISGHVVDSLSEAFGERMAAPALIEGIKALGLTGRKSGKGIYVYDKPDGKVIKDKKTGRPVVNPDVQALLPVEPVLKSIEEIQDRLVYVMINEAAKCLDEGVVTSPLSLDLAMIYCTGFPPYRGGVLHYADSIGMASVLQNLNRLTKNPDDSYRPSRLIEQLALSGKGLLSVAS